MLALFYSDVKMMSCPSVNLTHSRGLFTAFLSRFGSRMFLLGLKHIAVRELPIKHAYLLLLVPDGVRSLCRRFLNQLLT